ncbi:MAG: hypothetical protein WC455_23105 [Dehalococcoidia bacterium]|jgi:hypothetical protein
MSKWTKEEAYSDHNRRIKVVDETGAPVIEHDTDWGFEYFEVMSNDILDQIVREHNAHEALVESVKDEGELIGAIFSVCDWADEKLRDVTNQGNPSESLRKRLLFANERREKALALAKGKELK